MAVPFCISTRNELEVLLFRILISIWCCQCCELWPFRLMYNGISFFNLYFLDDVWHRASFHILICHLYCISSLIRCLLRSLAYFLNKWFIFLLLSFKSSLYILGNSLLSDMSFANIFSQYMACLFIPLTVSFTAEGFNFNEVQLINDFFQFVSKKVITIPEVV